MVGADALECVQCAADDGLVVEHGSDCLYRIVRWDLLDERCSLLLSKEHEASSSSGRHCPAVPANLKHCCTVQD